MTSLGTDVISEPLSPEAIFMAVCGEREEGTAVSPYLGRFHLLERMLVGVVFVLSLPVIAVLVVLIRATSKGPGIFSQKRVGLSGKVYTMYKLRTMRSDAEAKTGPVWSATHDPRTTFLGRLLRKAHLDELPQLYNVWRGDMRLVGPRPERPEFVKVLEESIPGYCERLRVLPGITGLAQVNLPPDTNLDSVRDKLELDVEYVKTADLSLDVRILICTVLKLLLIPGPLRLKLTGVGRMVSRQRDELDQDELSLTPYLLKSAARRRRYVHPQKPR